MKRHLFYTVLWVFIATATVTLGGIIGWIHVEPAYLEKLLVAFLIQIAGVVYSLFKQTDFFSEAEVKRLHVVESIVAQSAPIRYLPEPAASGTVEIKPQKAIAIDLDAATYFKKIAKLEERPLERDAWLREIHGKEVTWTGFFDYVESSLETANIQIGLSLSKSDRTGFFAWTPEKMRDLAYSLRKSDEVWIRGILDCSYRTYPSLKVIEIYRI